MKQETMWTCEIGVVLREIALPKGADAFMRDAIAEAFRKITGMEPDFIFSGWGQELKENQREVLRDNGLGIHGVHLVTTGKITNN